MRKESNRKVVQNSQKSRLVGVYLYRRLLVYRPKRPSMQVKETQYIGKRDPLKRDLVYRQKRPTWAYIYIEDNLYIALCKTILFFFEKLDPALSQRCRKVFLCSLLQRYMWPYTQASIQIYMHISVTYIYTYMHLYTYIHITYIHTYIYIHIYI